MKKNKEKIGNMASLDVFLTSLSTEEYKTIEPVIQSTAVCAPLLSMDLYSRNFHHSLELGKRKLDLSYLLQLEPELNSSFDHKLILQQYYDALVLTDIDQKITWVNKGFTKMTGYPAGFALGKSPKFLQGINTSTKTTQRIRQQLGNQGIFSEIVINYRKNKEEYKCEITIIPLFNNNQSLTHYLAIEKEVA